ncbi:MULTISPECIES: hypothetical protein [Sphingobacterium]|uniref:hypothetical protein n=1 Tax=Sphingobacterium TaxID=28453 RepID=UPI00258040FB|nr:MULTISPECIES: hypothetical protein [Sphingobacterium]
MNKKEALQFMKDGYKISHDYFQDHEWMTIRDGKILLEDGVKCSIEEFFAYRTSSDWEEDYSFFFERDRQAYEHAKYHDSLINSLSLAELAATPSYLWANMGLLKKQISESSEKSVRSISLLGGSASLAAETVIKFSKAMAMCGPVLADTITRAKILDERGKFGENVGRAFSDFFIQKIGCEAKTQYDIDKMIAELTLERGVGKTYSDWLKEKGVKYCEFMTIFWVKQMAILAAKGVDNGL